MSLACRFHRTDVRRLLGSGAVPQTEGRTDSRYRFTGSRRARCFTWHASRRGWRSWERPNGRLEGFTS
jgi:hypothetical protein